MRNPQSDGFETAGGLIDIANPSPVSVFGALGSLIDRGRDVAAWRRQDRGTSDREQALVDETRRESGD